MSVMPRELHILLVRHRRLLRGLAIAVAVVIVVGILKPGEREGVSVLVAARDIPAGTTLTEADLQARTIPGDLLPDQPLRPGAAILGRTLTGPARRGEVLTDQRILTPSLMLEPGTVAQPVRIADSASVSLLHAGDRVDVFAAVTRDQKPLVQRLTRNVLVLAVPVPAESGGEQGALVVLAVTNTVATTLARAALEANLSVTLSR